MMMMKGTSSCGKLVYVYRIQGVIYIQKLWKACSRLVDECAWMVIFSLKVNLSTFYPDDIKRLIHA